MIETARDTNPADAFDTMADEFAQLAEAASTVDQCVRYRDLEHSYRLRATEERVRQLSQIRYTNGRDVGTTAH